MHEPPTTTDEVRRLVREELASLGGHLLTTYGHRYVPVDDRGMASPKTDPGRPDLATLGGFLLEHYGDGAKPVAYRDPTPPAVGEPPTTVPGDGAALTENATVTKHPADGGSE